MRRRTIDDNRPSDRRTRRAVGLILVPLALSLLWLWNQVAAPEPARPAAGVETPPAVRQLLAALEDPREPVRLDAARTLGRMGVGAAVEPLRAMLLQGSGAEKPVAAEALARIASPEAIGALLDALADGELTSRRHAAMAALEALGEPAVGPLEAMLRSPDPVARSNAAEMLGWIGSPSAIQALLAALVDESAEVRGRAVWALDAIAAQM